MKSENEKASLTENQKKAEGHLEAASLHHLKAANYLKEGNYEKAAENAILAQEYLKRASDSRRGDMEKYID